VDIKSGTIKIDNQDITTITQNDLRKNIAYVPQESILFHRSLVENIAYSQPDATHEEVMAAAKKAHAHEFIQKMSEKYDTLVGERGIKLSGGEKQRIAIARAILKKSPILILDEATSSLDSQSEKLIQDSLKELMKDRTTLVIAHRLSTLKEMDTIMVLDQGKIVEMGSHEELLKQKGKYAELWSHQAGGFLGE
jgi:ATP-binding cassette subfamily B protein